MVSRRPLLDGITPVPRQGRFDAKGKCMVTGKRPYRDKVTALLHNADAKIIAQAYQCRWCLKWHLTRGRH